MLSGSTRQVVPLRRSNLPRGVYESVELSDGEHLIIVVSSHGYILDQYRPRIDETPRQLKAKGARLLRTVDSVTPPRPSLALVPDDVTAYAPRSSAARSWMLAPPPRLRVPPRPPQ